MSCCGNNSTPSARTNDTPLKAPTAQQLFTGGKVEVVDIYLKYGLTTQQKPPPSGAKTFNRER